MNTGVVTKKSDEEDKRVKKRKKRSKRRKISDPLVTSISQLLSSSLNLVSPENKHAKDKENVDNPLVKCENKESPIPKMSGSNIQTPRQQVIDIVNLKTEELESDSTADTPLNEIKEKSRSKNAFEFMMESSKKSIGRNSPGKEMEKPISVAKGENKNKLMARKLLFEKWATNKGSDKHKAEEKETEIYIKQQLQKRSIRMKKMLSLNGRKKLKKKRKPISDSEDSQDICIDTIPDVVSKLEDSIISIDDKNIQDNCKEHEMSKNCDDNGKISTKNEENKKKITKNPRRSDLLGFLGLSQSTKSEKRKFVEDDADDFIFDDNASLNRDNPIKIKMFSPTVFQRKKRINTNNSNEEIDEFEPKHNCEKIKHKKKKKLIEHKTKTTLNTDLGSESNSNYIEHCKRSTSNKRNSDKHSRIVNLIADESSTDSISAIENDTELCQNQPLRRSTRNKRRSSKYIDSLVTYQVDDDSTDSDCDGKIREKTLKKDQALKLAPIFMQNKIKPKIDPLVLEARKQFLMSGIPDALKRTIEKQQSIEEIEIELFPEISHVQQKSVIKHGIDYWNLPKANLKLIDPYSKISLPRIESLMKGSLTEVVNVQNQQILPPPEKIKNLKPILLEIKRSNPDFPVFRSFRLLEQKNSKLRSQEIVNQKSQAKMAKGHKGKRRKADKFPENQLDNQIDSMMWTEKYKANTHEDIIGNHSSTLALKKWLQHWLDITYNGSKILRRRGSSSSEFDCDSDSRHSAEYPSNAIIVHGPHGSGKTMTIYALCNELGINVLELNASSKRTGKRLIQELQEATQSHQVRKSENYNLNTFFNPANSKEEDNSNEVTESSRKKSKMCLLLVEDLDIVFEQDDGFLAALTQLLSSSKRPIILVATDISLPSLQKIVSQTGLIKFSSLSSKIISVWLQILCLVEGCFVVKESLSELLQWNKGDIRKTMLQLEFWVKSGGGNYSNIPLSKINEINSEGDLPNEDSRLSIDEVVVTRHSNCISGFVNRFQLSLDQIWWNLRRREPKLIANLKRNEVKCKKSELERFYEYSKTLSLIDNTYVKCDTIRNDNLSVKYALFELKDSIELSEVYTGCNTRKDFINEWADSLFTGYRNGDNTFLDMGQPSTEDRRWQKQQHSCKSKFMTIAPFSCNVDRRTFTLDYYPTLRTISRSEEVRFANSNKRRNRFVNYLRTLGLDCGDTTTNIARRVLNPTFSDNKKT